MEMNEYYDKNDDTLVQLTLLGKEDAFEELIIRYEHMVKDIAYKVTNCRFLAEDATQDAFVSAWLHLSSLRESNKFKAWVCSIVRNNAKNLVVHYRNAIPNISLDPYENYVISSDVDSDLLPYEDLHERVAALSEKIRETVKLYYFSDLSIKEIAKLCSISEGTVKWRLSEGRRQLRKGYGIMEKTYEENESILARVMRQVEALKLWEIKEDKSGFESEYQAVLKLINDLPESKEKSHALADTWLLGAWWLPGHENEEIYIKIKRAAEEGHNEEVMQAVACYEFNKYQGEEKRSFMRNTQIPYFEKKAFLSTLGYTWFWLGFEYREIGEYQKAIEAFQETLKLLPPENEYYANAKAAIYCESKVLEASCNEERKKIGIAATGEKYRFIDGKLYLWSQPGYGCLNEINTASIFWNLAVCNHLILDPNMQVGDIVLSETKKGKLTFISNTVVCNTTAGIFKNCRVYEFTGNVCELTYCKTFICEGIGIVRQEVEQLGVRRTYELSKYNIIGGKGVIPFAEGNLWEYSDITMDAAILYEKEIIFEVTAFQNHVATVSSAICYETIGYSDTYEGKIQEVMKTYHIGDCGKERLVDVRKPLQRAKELAVTKRQKIRVQVVEDVMLRILNSDPQMNPDYAEKGCWNFYSCIELKNNKGRIERTQLEQFAWKDGRILDNEGRKLLYSFFDEIVAWCGLGLWSDDWRAGYRAKSDNTRKKFIVLEEETVTTPAGTFPNCRHICFELDLNFYFGGKSDCWYAEGVGFVRYTHQIDEDTIAIWQLTEYRGTGKGYFPIADGLYRKYEPENVGDGFVGALEYIFDSDEKGTCIFRNATGMQKRVDYEKV